MFADKPATHITRLFFNKKNAAMRIASITFALLFSFSLLNASTPAGNDNNIYSPGKSLRKELVKMMDSPELSKNGIKDAEAEVRFLINEYNEVLVLSVKTDNPYLESFIKNRLDGQKVNTAEVDVFTKYNLKVSFASER